MSNTVIYRKGNTFLFDKKPPADNLDRLPAGVYELIVDPEGNIMVILLGDSYKTPDKLYGDIYDRVDIIYNTYKERAGKPTGVMLTGLKGTGKTQLAELLCNVAITNGLPVITLNTALPTPVIRKALTLLNPCVLYIDELDKLYSKQPQYGDEKIHELDKLASIIGSSVTNDVLTLVTTNKVNALPDVFINRPTRFYFRMEYNSLSLKVIEEMLIEHNVDLGWMQYLKLRRRSLTYDLLNTYITLFKKYVTSYAEREEFLKYENMYNLPKPDNVVGIIKEASYVGEGDVELNSIEGLAIVKVKELGEEIKNYSFDLIDIIHTNIDKDEFIVSSEDGLVEILINVVLESDAKTYGPTLVRNRVGLISKVGLNRPDITTKLNVLPGPPIRRRLAAPF